MERLRELAEAIGEVRHIGYCIASYREDLSHIVTKGSAENDIEVAEQDHLPRPVSNRARTLWTAKRALIQWWLEWGAASEMLKETHSIIDDQSEPQIKRFSSRLGTILQKLCRILDATHDAEPRTFYYSWFSVEELRSALDELLEFLDKLAGMLASGQTFSGIIPTNAISNLPTADYIGPKTPKQFRKDFNSMSDSTFRRLRKAGEIRVWSGSEQKRLWIHKDDVAKYALAPSIGS